ncbi:hypothetical protein b3_0092 [Synechococcus phage B3]|nr:hypothetical protein b3_0092 [Synechococcus phage B3]QGT54706.1 hypothetical protein b23_0091 [Synechococcus phage B23]
MIEFVVISYVTGFACVFLSLVTDRKIISRDLNFYLFTAFAWPIFIVLWISIMCLAVYNTIKGYIRYES